MAEPRIVTCVKLNAGDTEIYGTFTHEADMVLISVSDEYIDGKITAAEATEAMRPYREFHPEIFAPDFESEDEGGWKSLVGSVFENEASGPTSDFIDEAVALRIPGVGDGGGSPGSGLILSIETDEGLEILRKRMEGKYNIVVQDHNNWVEWQASHEAAYRMIARLRERAK